MASKAIFRLSGDHRGAPVAPLPKEVNWTAFKPSLSHTQISRLPERSEAKAMRLPSGECGKKQWSVRPAPRRGVGHHLGESSISPSRRAAMIRRPPSGCLAIP